MSAETAFRLTSALFAVGACLSALEYLAILPQFNDNAIFSWRVFGSSTRRTRFALLGVLRDRCFSPAGVRWMMLARVGASLVMLVPGVPAVVAGTGATVVFLTCLAMTRRCGYGEDGSDQMLLIVSAGLAAYAFVPDHPLRPAGLWFIGAQAVLSYGAAGFAKLASPVWRGGQASQLIFRTATYSFDGLAHLLAASPRLSWVLSWTTIAFECLFPLVLIAPQPVALSFLAAGVVFHLLNAVVMGLNVFFWAFLATYPAIMLLREWR